MTQTEALDALISAVEAGRLEESGLRSLPAPMWHGGLWVDPGAFAVLAFDGSLDAAKRLHDALLPGWAAKIWAMDDEDADASVYPPMVAIADYERIEGVDIFSAEVDGDNPSRAWLLATLKAYRETLE